MKPWLDVWVESLPWYRRLWWEVWHTRLCWWLDLSWGWIIDRPYWRGMGSDEVPYLETIRTGRRVDSAPEDWN